MNTVSPQGNAQSQPEAWSSRAANTWLDDCFETPINLNYFWEVMKWENTYSGVSTQVEEMLSYHWQLSSQENTCTHPVQPTTHPSLVKDCSILLNGLLFFTSPKEKNVHNVLSKLICMAFSCSYLHLLTGIKALTFLLVKSFPGNLLISSNEYLCKQVQN